MMQKRIRLFEEEPLDEFFSWANGQFDLGAKIITIEGPPGAGKSSLARSLASSETYAIDLDTFLNESDLGDVSWLERVRRSSALDCVRRAMTHYPRIVVDGTVAFPFVKPLLAELSAAVSRKVYVVAMTRAPDGTLVWDLPDMEEVKALGVATQRSWYNQSTDLYHSSPEPLEEADLVVETVPKC